MVVVFAKFGVRRLCTCERVNGKYVVMTDKLCDGICEREGIDMVGLGVSTFSRISARTATVEGAAKCLKTSKFEKVITPV